MENQHSSVRTNGLNINHTGEIIGPIEEFQNIHLNEDHSKNSDEDSDSGGVEYEVPLPVPKNMMDFIETGDDNRFEVFNSWCEKEGVVMPKLNYPVWFDGLLGIECTDEIKHREAFMFVPMKMLMTVGKAQNHPVLGKIIEQNP